MFKVALPLRHGNDVTDDLEELIHEGTKTPLHRTGHHPRMPGGDTAFLQRPLREEQHPLLKPLREIAEATGVSPYGESLHGCCFLFKP